MGIQSKFGDGTRKKSYRLPSFWSFSRWQDFNKCPLYYEGKHIAKLKFPSSPALARGIAVHQKGEAYLKSTSAKVPSEYAYFKTEMVMLRTMEFTAEASWAVTNDWKPCEATDWGNAWLRGKGDACLLTADTLDIIDYKTGRMYDAHKEQAELVAAIGFSQYPEALTVHFENWYLDKDEVSTFDFDRATLPATKKRWGKFAKNMLSETEFKATPSAFACRFCPMRSDRKLADGSVGSCEAWKEI